MLTDAMKAKVCEGVLNFLAGLWSLAKIIGFYIVVAPLAVVALPFILLWAAGLEIIELGKKARNDR